MNKAVKNISIALVILAVLFMSSIFLIAPILNNSIAADDLNKLKATPLPEKTKLCESISVAGKLIGNGNGMQYFSAILIKSELDLDELKDYYRQFNVSGFSHQVCPQTNETISVSNEVVGRSNALRFDTLENSSDILNYYTVYTWGDSDFVFKDMDLRAH